MVHCLVEPGVRNSALQNVGRIGVSVSDRVDYLENCSATGRRNLSQCMRTRFCVLADVFVSISAGPTKCVRVPDVNVRVAQ